LHPYPQVLFWDFRPPVPLERNIPLKGDLIVDVRIITVICRNKPPFRGEGGQIEIQKVKLAIKNIIPESIPEPPF